jgi:hypothetical protein
MVTENVYYDIHSQSALVLHIDLVRRKLFHSDDEGGESQEPYNRFESKRAQTINMEIQKERKQYQ